VPSAQRATLISVDSWLISMTMIVAFPLAGWLAGREGWGTIHMTCGAVQVGLTVLLVIVRQFHARRVVAAPVGELQGNSFNARRGGACVHPESVAMPNPGGDKLHPYDVEGSLPPSAFGYASSRRARIS
jgi:hypothetical protein